MTPKLQDMCNLCDCAGRDRGRGEARPRVRKPYNLTPRPIQAPRMSCECVRAHAIRRTIRCAKSARHPTADDSSLASAESPPGNRDLRYFCLSGISTNLLVTSIMSASPKMAPLPISKNCDLRPKSSCVSSRSRTPLYLVLPLHIHFHETQRPIVRSKALAAASSSNACQGGVVRMRKVKSQAA